MALPKAAQRQIDEADRLVRELNLPAAKKAAPAPLTEAISPSADSSGEPAPVEQQASPQELIEKATVTELPTPQAAPVEDFEQKWRSLDGMLASERTKHSNEMTRMQNRLDSMQNVITSIQNSQAAPASTQPAKSSLLTQEELDDYGEDMIDVVRRITREETADALARLEKISKENTDLKRQMGNVTGQVAETSRDRLLSQLAHEVPNWAQLNEDAGFLRWLAQIDPFSGLQRQKMLSTAQEANDANRVVAFFKGYLNETATVTNQARAPVEANATPKVDMNTLVAPGKPRGTSTGAQQADSKPIWTPQEVQAFYRDVQRGKYSSRPEERLRIEQGIIDAANEGRIR